MAIQLEAATRLKALSFEDPVTIVHDRIYLGKKAVGIIESSTTKETYASLLGYYGDSKKVARILDTLKIPQKFNYVWVDKVLLRKAFRGQGLGARTFETLTSKIKRPCVIGLNPGEISVMDIKTIGRFYKKIGFTVFTLPDGNCALKYIP